MKNYAKTSILGFNYSQKTFDERLSKTIFQQFELPEILCNLLASKNVALAEVEEFLNPKIKTSLPDPFGLKDMEKGVNHLISAIKNNKKITIFADYDVDGASSAAILKRFLREINVDCEIYIPDRILEGYGPNSNAFEKLKKQNIDLVITLDCGTVSFEPLLKAKEIGLDVIVIDHHIGVEKKPEALAIINPNSIDDNFPHKNLCAAGVTFLFVVAVNKTLREMGFYDYGKTGSLTQSSCSVQKGESKDWVRDPLPQMISTLPQGDSKKEPNLLNLLDLVALGTVCDVMKLTSINRTFVSAGLKILKQRQNLGLKTICDLAGINEEPNAYHLGFIIGPRINAGGRVGNSNLGAELLSTLDEERAIEIATKLEELNKERKEIEAQVLAEAISQLEEKQITKYIFSNKNDQVLFVASKNWHQGVIGIVASRLKDLYQKPAIVIAIDEKENKAKASCRSISGIDLGAEILNARMQGLLLDGGGHAMAGGFSILPEKITELHQFFNQKLSTKIIEANKNKLIEFDLALDLEQINLEILKEISKLEPFGVGNARPKFMIKNLVKISANLVGVDKNHLSIIFASKSQIGFNKNISAIFFNVDDKISSLILDAKFNSIVDVVGNLSINSWQKKERINLQIEDILI
jgi:single-stranded-DNA-specific exonuclease